ncbi:MAG: enoyl-CoA hydratase/isomerase family protein [Chitinophagales bacterium]
MSFPDYQTIRLDEIEPGILGVVLNRPEKLNALNRLMLDELTDLWAKLKHKFLDPRVIILRGEGPKGFCGGLDIKESVDESMLNAPALYDWQTRLAEVQLAMRQIPQPIICLVHGAAAGAGFSFSLASDIRIISPDARFSAFYINVGLGGADMGSSYFLPRMIGFGRAYEFLLTGRFMSAEEAVALGYVSRCVEREQLMDNALELARIMVSKDPLAIRLTKEAVNKSLEIGGLEAVLYMENRNQSVILMHNMSKGATSLG